MIKAVIFDMFETLVTLFSGPVYMGREIAAEIGLAEPKFREIWDTTDEARTLGKRSLESVIEEILTVNNCYSEELFESIITKRKRMISESFDHIHPEIIPLFQWFQEQNIKIGLITNCYFEERDIIKDSVFFDYFDVMCMSCELGVKKPDTRIFERCLEDLGLEAAECLYVGDGGSLELETAQAVGMHPLQAAWYLKDGTRQPVKRKAEFSQAESPLNVITEISRLGGGNLMNKTIIMVQHTESEHHLNGMIGACYDWELTENGKKQANRIGKWLSSIPDIQEYHMYVSDRKRALQTADEINTYLCLTPVVTGAIREVNAGEGNGKPVAWYREHELPHPPTYDPDYRPFPDAESDRDLWNRIYPFYEEIKNNDEEKILIVSHGTALSYLQTMLFGDSLEDIPKRRFIGSSGSISQFVLEESGRVVVRYINRQCGE